MELLLEDVLDYPFDVCFDFFEAFLEVDEDIFLFFIVDYFHAYFLIFFDEELRLPDVALLYFC